MKGSTINLVAFILVSLIVSYVIGFDIDTWQYWFITLSMGFFWLHTGYYARKQVIDILKEKDE